MKVWVRYVKGKYVSGYGVSGERFDEYIYDVDTPLEAVKAFESEFNVKVDEIVEG